MVTVVHCLLLNWFDSKKNNFKAVPGHMQMLDFCCNLDHSKGVEAESMSACLVFCLNHNFC